MKKYLSNNPTLSNKEASVVGRFIDEEFGGNVTASQLLEAARPRSSPIHEFFDWDDTSAAEKYRLKQAGKLIISVYVVADNNKQMRRFLRVNIGDGPTYLDRDQVKEDQDLIDQVIVAAKDQLLRWQDRYGAYCEFFEFKFEMKGKTHEIRKEAKGIRRKAIDNSGRKRQARTTNHNRNQSANG